MDSQSIRKAFLKFFEGKGHQIVPSAPVVVKDDPTLMFINAGMNPFKDYFLGTRKPEYRRVSDSQKCLRVSGKQNDLDEVGVDTYHHTLFEMLGNWSFGDYFKTEAIDWAWELLTEVYKIPKEDIYATYFHGDKEDGTAADDEAKNHWAKILPAEHIIGASKKDNFWEMGDTGPCGPCSELHVDMRTAEEKAKVPGQDLVNEDHPQVIEIWNLVFIQFERKADRSLHELPEKHIDTGMGFERLCMALQGKKSSYDTDVFSPIIKAIEKETGFKYGQKEETDVAIRVIADHLRAISFAIADGQLPSNTGAGYVIRRILRRAVRYAYSVLNRDTPIIHTLVDTLDAQMGEFFPELRKSKDFIKKIILEEEKSFLQTLAQGIKRFDQIKNKDIDGATAFELYDTFGFPFDLTELMAREAGISVDEAGFKAAMEKQKNRSRSASESETGDWTVLHNQDGRFVGYDSLMSTTRVIRYRKVSSKNKDSYQLVLEETPFYAESGGQVGDTGLLYFGEEKIPVIDTKKENKLFVHLVKKLPTDIAADVRAEVNRGRRTSISSNHTATHLLHAALREKLGTHVEQKGSLVGPDYLRFDFSHFSKIEAEDLLEIERQVNAKIRENIALQEDREMAFDDAVAAGAMALFGEKYGDKVRMITFDPNFSRELCGGTHVEATGMIGLCKITAEVSVASGVRRLEALTGAKAFDAMNKERETLSAVMELMKSPKDLVKTLGSALQENGELKKQLEKMQAKEGAAMKDVLKGETKEKSGLAFLAKKITVANAEMVKQIAFDLKREVPNLFAVLGAEIDGKAHLTIMMDEAVSEAKGFDASKMIREIAKHIQGGGGGQNYYATAGGKKPEGLDAALKAVEDLIA